MKKNESWHPSSEVPWVELIFSLFVAGGLTVLFIPQTHTYPGDPEGLSTAFVQKVEPKASLSSTCVLEPSKVVQTYICTVLGGVHPHTVVCQIGSQNSAVNGCWVYNNHELDGE